MDAIRSSSMDMLRRVYWLQQTRPEASVFWVTVDVGVGVNIGVKVF